MCRRFLIAAARSRIVVAICVLGYLGATIGFPLPVTVAQKPGRPFPCQDHACGCASADQCWASCCCFTAPEKLAWARANHVEPPAELLAELGEAADPHHQRAEHEHEDHSHDHHDHHQLCSQHAGGEASQSGEAKKTGGVASTKAARAPAAGQCCAQTKAARGASLGGSKSLTPKKPATRTNRTQLVIGPLWRSCRGLSTEWCASGAVAPPPVPVVWNFRWDVCERLAPTQSLSAGGQLAPPIPPPPQV